MQAPHQSQSSYCAQHWHCYPLPWRRRESCFLPCPASGVHLYPLPLWSQHHSCHSLDAGCTGYCHTAAGWHESVTASSPVSLLRSHSALSAAGNSHLHHVCTWNSQPHKLVYSIHTKDLAADRNGFLVLLVRLSSTSIESSLWKWNRN